jgi:hypothetical protein
VLVVPALGQVHGDVAAAVAGDAGGDADEVAADGRAAGFRVERPGQRPGGAGQVVADSRAGQPRGVGGEVPRGQVGQGAVAEVGEDLLDDGVVAVMGLGLDGLERRVGEDGVVAPAGEQLVLAGGGLAVEVADAADDQPGGDRLALVLRGERGIGVSATCASEISRPWSSSQTARG